MSISQISRYMDIGSCDPVNRIVEPSPRQSENALRPFLCLLVPRYYSLDCSSDLCREETRGKLDNN